MKTSRRDCAAAILVFLAGIPSGWAAQAGPAAAAPVPPLIASAKTVFLSNGGTDNVLRSAFAKAGDGNLAYDDLYLSMKSWGHYTVVASPGEADLVLEIRVVAPYDGKDSYDPQSTIDVFDGRTHFLLWSFAEPLKGAFRKSTFEKNVQQSVDAAVATLKQLAATRATP